MKKKMMMVSIFEPPPVTREEALNPNHNNSRWLAPPMGYQGNGGDGPPSDHPLDCMVYPRDAGPMEKADHKREHDRETQAQAFREERLRRSRDFSIAGDHKPPSSFGEEE